MKEIDREKFLLMQAIKKTNNDKIDYWSRLIEFALKYHKYEDLIKVIEQIKFAELPRLQNQSFYLKCLDAILSILEYEDLEEDINPKMNEIFDCLRNFSIDTSSDQYVILFSRMHRYNGNWEGYSKFLNWWNLDKIHLRFSNKLMYSNVFGAELTIRECYSLVTATNIIRNDNQAETLTKTKRRGILELLFAIEKLEISNRVSIETKKVELDLLLILDEFQANLKFLINNIHLQEDLDIVDNLLMPKFNNQPQIQLNFLCYLATTSKCNKSKMKYLRYMIPIYIYLKERILALSISKQIQCYCSRNGLPIFQSDIVHPSLDDLLRSFAPKKQILLEELNQRSNEVQSLITS